MRLNIKMIFLLTENTGVWTQKDQKLHFNDPFRKYVTKPRKILF